MLMTGADSAEPAACRTKSATRSWPEFWAAAAAARPSALKQPPSTSELRTPRRSMSGPAANAQTPMETPQAPYRAPACVSPSAKRGAEAYNVRLSAVQKYANASRACNANSSHSTRGASASSADTSARNARSSGINEFSHLLMPASERRSRSAG